MSKNFILNFPLLEPTQQNLWNITKIININSIITNLKLIIRDLLLKIYQFFDVIVAIFEGKTCILEIVDLSELSDL